MKKILSGLFIGFLFSTAVFAFSVNEMGQENFFEAIYLVTHNGVSSDFVVGYDIEKNSKNKNEIVVEKAVSAGEIKEININTSVTDVNIKEDEAIDEIMVKQVVKYKSSKGFEPETITVENRDGKTYIELRKKNFTNKVTNYSGEVFITIPKGLVVNYVIDSSVGDINIDIKEIKEDMKINNSVGTINIKSNELAKEKKINAESSVGDIEIDILRMGEHSTIDVSNSVGDVEINRNLVTKNTSVDLETSIGDIKVDNLDEIRREAETYKVELDKLNQFLVIEPFENENSIKIVNSTGDIKLK